MDALDRLLDQGHTPTDIACALTSMLREASGRGEGSEIQEDREPERPERKRGPKQGRDREHSGRMDGGHKQAKSNRDFKGDHTEEGMTKLFLSMGKTHGVNPKDIVGMLYGEAGLPNGSLGKIKLFPRHSLVDVPSEFANQVIDRTQKSKLKGRPFKLDFDRGPVQRD